MHVRFGADAVHDRLAEAARAAYEIGVGMLRPGIRFSEVCDAMRAPIAEADAWSRAPLLQTCSPITANGAMWVGALGRRDLEGIPLSPEVPIDHDFTVEEGMIFAFEPNAVNGLDQVCVGGTVLVTALGAEELNDLPTRAHVRDC
jgi:Xaa-Pro aminopeptidase